MQSIFSLPRTLTQPTNSFGFDRNNSANQYMFYNVAGTWNNSSFPGSWMIRPVLSMSNIVLHHEFIKNKITFYPNPTNGNIFFNLYLDKVEVYSLLVCSKEIDSNTSFEW